MKEKPPASGRREVDRERVIDVAMKHFAENGYRGAHVEEIANDLGIAKGSVFRHFHSKEELFLAAFKRAVSSLPAWLDAPKKVVAEGTWATVRYWLERTEKYVHDDWVPNQVALIGRFGTDLELQGPIGRFMRSEDPYGTLELVEYGVRRGEIRDDIDVEMLASVIDWLTERFQDAQVAEDLDPGLIHRKPDTPERRQRRIDEFMEVLQSALGKR